MHKEFSLLQRIADWYVKLSVIGSRVVLVATVEAILVAAAIVVSLFASPTSIAKEPLLIGLILLVPIRLAFLFRYNLVRGWWRYTGFTEALDVVKAIGSGSIVFIIFQELVLRSASIQNFQWSYSAYLTEACLSATLLISARASSRIFADAALRRHRDRQRILLIGAGQGAILLINELRSENSSYEVVGCLDDDWRKQKIRIEGVNVLGPIASLPDVVKHQSVSEIWIAIPSASHEEMARFVNLCQSTHTPFKTLPRLSDIVVGNVVQQVREINAIDLLPRKPIEIDFTAIRSKIKGKVAMVTGAAGSIGSELCRQLLAFEPEMLICVDQNETGMFYLEIRQRPFIKDVPVIYRVADICNLTRMEQIMNSFNVEIIFHAAAYKHVPVMEMNIQEAVYNNVLSLMQLLDCAERANVRNFVMISSDKAVNPTNVMGTTKRIGELIIASRPRSTMDCVAVRFGNVLGSNGSVVPLLQEQIRNGREVTITHPEIKRYFMTINEAVSLVLQAFTVGKHSDILVLDMGEPVRIVDMARNLIRLSGKTEDEVKIRFIGLREGEKLKEELFYEHEQVLATERAKVLRTRSRVVGWKKLSEMLDDLALRCESGSTVEICEMLMNIVPEYLPMSRSVRTTAAAAGVGDSSRSTRTGPTKRSELIQ